VVVSVKKLIIYSSVHKGNTEKVAKAMAQAIKADLVKVGGSSDAVKLTDYDLIGFGSGIYGGKPDAAMMGFIEKLPGSLGIKAFVFMTCGFERSRENRIMQQELSSKGFEVIGNFACRGFTDYGLLKIVGGVSKGRPNERDLLDAKNFALRFIEYA
jgi:flavodoxin